MSIGLLTYGLLLVGYATVFSTLFLMSLAIFNKLRYRYMGYKFDMNYTPKITLVAPAHNEGDVLERTIKAFLKLDYPDDKKEMLIVNDGSTDNTAKVAEKFAGKVIDSKTKKIVNRRGKYSNIVLVNRPIGGLGKAHVLNDGKKFSTGEFLFIIDADISLQKDAFRISAAHFADKRVGALVGYVSVFDKPDYVLNGFVSFEFSLAQRILRLGFDTLGIHYIIPGGNGVFRKSTLDVLGDYTADTLAEDTDMSWRLLTETNKKVHFDPNIIAIADEPVQLRSLWNQRVRWSRGNLGVTIKNLKKVGRSRYGKAATFGYPFWFSSIIMPFGFLFSSIGFLLATLFNVDLGLLNLPTRIISIAFFVLYGLTILYNKGKYWFQGLISPGIPMMVTLLSILVFPNGFEGMMNILGYSQYATEVTLGFLTWIIISLFMTYPMVVLSDKHPKLANYIHLTLFGYWSVLIVSGVWAYLQEFKGDERVWIRTVRV